MNWNLVGLDSNQKDNVGFVPEYGAYPIGKEDALFKLLSNPADE